MHQDAADGVMAHASLGIPAGRRLAQHAESLCTVALPGEFGRVVQHQHGSVANGGNALARGAEMPSQDVSLADALVAEESIGRLGVGPVLADERDALAGGLGELSQQRSQPPGQANVLEDALVQLPINPAAVLDLGVLTVLCDPWIGHDDLRLCCTAEHRHSAEPAEKTRGKSLSY